MNKSKECEIKLKGVDFSNPKKLVGLNDVVAKDKAPVLLSILVEIASLASVMGKFQEEPQNDISKMREGIKKMISNISC